MRRIHSLTKIFVILIVFVSGCATQTPFSITVCPPDKALVYVYWAYWFPPSPDTLEIDVNQIPRAKLHTAGYYPFLLDPGSVTLGFSQWLPPLPVHSRDTNSLNLTVEAGKTYYVAYDCVMRFKPRLVQVDASVAEEKIKNYTLSKELEK